jgi:transposase-like protein
VDDLVRAMEEPGQLPLPRPADFLRGLARRGLAGVELVISDAHEGLKAAVTKVLRATWQRFRIHFARSALVRAGNTLRRIVSAWIQTAYAEPDAQGAILQWRTVADQLQQKVPKLAALMDSAEEGEGMPATGE